jgi:hypothetical protein
VWPCKPSIVVPARKPPVRDEQQAQQSFALQCYAFEGGRIADKSIAGKLYDGLGERNLAIQGRGGPYHAIFTDHCAFDRLAGGKTDDHGTSRK